MLRRYRLLLANPVAGGGTPFVGRLAAQRALGLTRATSQLVILATAAI